MGHLKSCEGTLLSCRRLLALELQTVLDMLYLEA